MLFAADRTEQVEVITEGQGQAVLLADPLRREDCDMLPIASRLEDGRRHRFVLLESRLLQSGSPEHVGRHEQLT